MDVKQEQIARPSGWRVFAGSVLLLAGCFNVIWGLVALFNPRVITISTGELVIWDFKVWGWIYIVVGALMAAASVGLFMLQPWTRWAAVVFAGLSAVISVVYFPAYPLFSLLMVILDVVVIYQLSVRWQDVA
ncbi:MAG TPA: hypothetical protein VKI99_00925 [Candidatus Dormibacteraeota bacterium]|nr:hypothetical protein [Candidatus Dormibacteraeota bacterium]